MLIKQTTDMTDSERIAVENSNNQWLQALSYTAVGTIYPYAGTVAPDSFMICDGSALDKNEYPELFAVIGYIFGGSDDTFNIPDLRGRTLVGLKSDDKDFDTIGKSAGEKEHNLTILEMPAHTHTLWSNIAGTDTAAVNTFDNIGYFPSGIITNQGKSVHTGSAGSGKPHNNMQPYMVCNYIIKVVNKLSNKLNIVVNVKADEEYNPDSENAQSGKAVAEAVEQLMPKVLPACSERYDQILVIKDIQHDENGELSYKYSTFPIDQQHEYTSGGLEEPYCIPIRNYNACLTTNYPSDEYDCTNKAYVDGLVGDIETLLGGI